MKGALVILLYYFLFADDHACMIQLACWGRRLTLATIGPRFLVWRQPMQILPCPAPEVLSASANHGLPIQILLYIIFSLSNMRHSSQSI
jgi:hypothetical protein